MRQLPLILIALASIVSCSKENLLPGGDSLGEDDEMKLIRVGVENTNLRTKSISSRNPAYDDIVNNYQIAVFLASNGQRKAYANSSDSTSSMLLIPTGKELIICALVNSPTDISGITTYSNLMNKKSQFSNNKLTSFEMFGQKNVTVTDQDCLTLQVERFACKVTVDELLWSIDCGYYELDYDYYCVPLPTKMMLMNIPSECSYDFKGSTTKFTATAADCARAGYSNPSISECYFTIDQTRYYFLDDGIWNGPYDRFDPEAYGRMTNHERFWSLDAGGYAYTYPNSSADKPAQLCIVLTGSYTKYNGVIGNHRHYFTFTLPPLEHNVEYHIHRLIIGMSGINNYTVGVKDFPLTVSASALVESIDMTTGVLIGKEVLNEVLYEKDF